MNQQVNCSATCSQRQGNLIVLSGPSGVGKGTVVAQLLEQTPHLLRSISVTTRQKRNSELDCIDYFFLTKEQFSQSRASGELLEWAEYAGAFYGTPRSFVRQQQQDGNDVLLVIEVAGARQIAQLAPEAVLIFLSPPSFEALESRLAGRATEQPEQVASRLVKAKEEISQKELFAYEVVNDIVEIAVNNLQHIIYSERLKIRQPIR